MLSCACIAASAFMPSPQLSVRTPVSPRSAAASVRLNIGEERVESVKACAIAAISGTFWSAPVKASEFVAAKGAAGKATALLVAQWQYSFISLAVQLALFGAVYRCAVRNDNNDMLKQGAVGAFALCRSCAATQVLSLSGPDTWLQLGTYFGESILAFGGAAAALEYAWNRGYARRLPGIGLPQYWYDEPPPYYRDGPGPPFNRGGPPLPPPEYFDNDGR